jgi:TonB family protein
MKSLLFSSFLALLCGAHLTYAGSSELPPAAASQSAYSLDQVDRPPVVQSQAQPVYPEQLHRARVSGEAKVQFVVDTTGAATHLECLACTAPEFAESALAAIQQWHFTPAQKNGQPVACRLVVPIVFSLSK